MTNRLTHNDLSCISPSIDEQTHEIIGTTDFRIIRGFRYRKDKETAREFENFLDSITLIRIVRKDGESEVNHTHRAYALMEQWWMLGETWQS